MSKLMHPDTVLLLGIDTPIGLSIIRELGANGVLVVGLGSSPTSLGRYSRFTFRSYTREKNENALVAQISLLIKKYKAKALMAVSESDMQLLNRHRPALSATKLLIPKPHALELALDKQKTCQLASELGIDVPRTYSVKSFEEFNDLLVLDEFEYPVVLKWPDPQSVSKLLRENGLEFLKAEYAYSHSELTQKIRRYIGLGRFPIIQSYCSGSGLGQFFLIHEGSVVRRFQHIRTHEWPPEGGFSSLCAAVPLTEHQSLMSKSESLLRKMDWEGVAMVEYRYSPQTNRAYLMEVNGRFWGSLPLAYHCGAGFAFAMYYYSVYGKAPELPSIRTNLQCRYMIPETKRLIRVIAQPDKIADTSFRRRPWSDTLLYIFGFLNPQMRYFLFSCRDPWPFFADLRTVFAKMLKSS